MPRKGDYLFRRKGSQNWYLRIQYPKWLAEKEGRNKVEMSLGTPDKAEAEILAAEEITHHKRVLWLRKQLLRTNAATRQGPKRYPPDTHHLLPNGESVTASEDTLSFFSADGILLRKEQNSETIIPIMHPTIEEIRELRELIPKKEDRDRDILETWINHRKISGHLAAEAWSTWEEFRSLIGSKPLSRCKREDGRELAKHLFAKGNKSATVDKKIGHLRAAVNLAMDEGKIGFNPFSDVVEKKDDAIDRGILNAQDMIKAKSSLATLSKHDQLLWKLLATTGMRLGEAFQIDAEFEEDGTRFVVIGSKTLSSRRRVPLPTILLPDLPPLIECKLFDGIPEVSGKRLRYYLRRLDISYDRNRNTGSKKKVVHSLRHRAADRLRAAQCPDSVRLEILGHERKTVAAGYGHGSPVSLLKRYIDFIGY